MHIYLLKVRYTISYTYVGPSLIYQHYSLDCISLEVMQKTLKMSQTLGQFLSHCITTIVQYVWVTKTRLLFG